MADTIGTVHTPRVTDGLDLTLGDLRPSFEGLQVFGLGDYNQRQLVLPTWVGMQKYRTLAPYVEWLWKRGVGPGPDRVLPIPSRGRNYFEALTDDQCAWINRWLDQDSRRKLQFFLVSQVELDFVRHRLGRTNPLSVIWGPSLKMAQVNRKDWLRRWCKRNDVAVRFPKFYIVPLRETDAITNLTKLLLEQYGGVVIKHPSLASGIGMYFVHRGDAWKRELSVALKGLARYGPELRIIIEAAHFNHVSLSAQLEIDHDEVRYLIGTRNEVAGGLVHEGNTLSTKGIPGVPRWVQREMRRQALAQCGALERRDYIGYIGLDFMWAQDTDEVFLLEANGRLTGGMNPYAVLRQAQANGLGDGAVIWRNVIPGTDTDLKSLTQLYDAEGIGFDGKTGLIVACPGLLRRRARQAPHGKMMLCAVGKNVNHAEALMRHGRGLVAGLPRAA